MKLHLKDKFVLLGYGMVSKILSVNAVDTIVERFVNYHELYQKQFRLNYEKALMNQGGITLSFWMFFVQKWRSIFHNSAEKTILHRVF